MTTGETDQRKAYQEYRDRGGTLDFEAWLRITLIGQPFPEEAPSPAFPEQITVGGQTVPIVGWGIIATYTDSFGNNKDVYAPIFPLRFFSPEHASAAQNLLFQMDEGTTDNPIKMTDDDITESGLVWETFFPQYAHASLVTEGLRTNVFTAQELDEAPALNAILLDWRDRLSGGEIPDANVLVNQLLRTKEIVPSLTELREFGLNLEDFPTLRGRFAAPFNELTDFLEQWGLRALTETPQGKIDSERLFTDLLRKKDLNAALEFVSGLPEESRRQVLPIALSSSFAGFAAEGLTRIPITRRGIEKSISTPEGLARFEDLLRRSRSRATEFARTTPEVGGFQRELIRSLGTEVGETIAVSGPGVVSGPSDIFAAGQGQQRVEAEERRKKQVEARFEAQKQRLLAPTRRPQRIARL